MTPRSTRAAHGRKSARLLGAAAIFGEVLRGGYPPGVVQVLNGYGKGNRERAHDASGRRQDRLHRLDRHGPGCDQGRSGEHEEDHG